MSNLKSGKVADTATDTTANLAGKVCLVTGATNGIGFVTVRALARMGAEVVLVGRSEERCRAAVELIEWESRQPPVGAAPQAAPAAAPAIGKASYLIADLSLMSQVRQVARQFLDQHNQLDMLINNAGATFISRQLTTEGMEMTWALNHLNYFLLTQELLGVLKDTAAARGEARVVNVSSAAHRGSRIHFDNLQGEHGYNGWRAYGQSKLANVLFTFELARRMQGSGVTANALHPGFVATGFGHNNGRVLRLFMRLANRFALTPEQGAETSIYLASSPQLRGVTGMLFCALPPNRRRSGGLRQQDRSPAVGSQRTDDSRGR